MACIDACPVAAISIDQGIGFYSPIINQELCIDCGRCVGVCQQLHPAKSREPLAWYQGWAKDPAERMSSSSGGLASAIARAFAASGGAVCACSFSGGHFGFEIVDNPCEIGRFKGSKYVKSDPTGAYIRIGSILKNGGRALFIGLPCQVSAMHNFVGEKLSERLYTIDLICHGTPSPRLLDLFLIEHGKTLDNLKDISFRDGTSFQISGCGETIDVPGVTDHYLIAFLSGLDYTENCYSCAYAKRERVSDISLGDSWGTELTGEMRNGVSLVLCQTLKGKELLDLTALELFPVDSELASANNDQLNRPSVCPAGRLDFLEDIVSGMSFEQAIRRALPKQYLRQEIKRTLIRIGLWHQR